MMLSPVGIGGAVELHQSLRAPDPLGCLPPRHSRAIVDYRSHPSRTKSVTLLHFAQVKDALSLSRRAGVPLSLMNKPSIFFSFVVVWIATAAAGQASAHPALVNSQATNCRSCHTEVFQQRPVLCEPAADDCSSRHEARIEQCTRAIDRAWLYPPLRVGPPPTSPSVVFRSEIWVDIPGRDSLFGDPRWPVPESEPVRCGLARDGQGKRRMNRYLAIALLSVAVATARIVVLMFLR